jgi:hypothetical protein
MFYQPVVGVAIERVFPYVLWDVGLDYLRIPPCGHPELLWKSEGCTENSLVWVAQCLTMLSY